LLMPPAILYGQNNSNAGRSQKSDILLKSRRRLYIIGV
jgi:hypothetical protein